MGPTKPTDPPNPILATIMQAFQQSQKKPPIPSMVNSGLVPAVADATRVTRTPNKVTPRAEPLPQPTISAAAEPLPEFDNLVSAVMHVESGGNLRAVSPKGAIGTMQTMPHTLRDPGYGVRPARNDSHEELERVGKEYLAAMMTRFDNNLDHALIAYNWGPGNASKWLTEGADYSKLPKETRDYIIKVRKRLKPR